MTGTPAILNNVRTVWRNCAITNGPAARTKRFERTPLNSLNNETREYARSLIEASLDPLVTISPEGKITEWSRTRVHAFENSTKNEGPVIAAKSNHEQYRCRLESLTLTMLPSRPIFLRVFSASISTRRYHHFRRSFANEDSALNYGNARTLFPRLAVERRIKEAGRTDRLTKWGSNRSTTVNIKSPSA